MVDFGLRQANLHIRNSVQFLHLLFLTLILLSNAMPSDTQDTMRYIYHPPESQQDQRYLYHWEILRTALDKTFEQFGPYKLFPSEFMTEVRQVHELKNATGKLTVMYLSTKPDFETNLIPIRIPVDKNLGGYCLFLIRKENQDLFKSIKTLNDLRKFTFGLGQGWIDVDILKANQFKVVTGSSYEGLFEMLIQKRFDLFLRAAVEITGEYDDRISKYPDLFIEENLLFYYPLPMYFWFSKTPEGKHLATRAEAGMRMMIKDGTYDRIFNKYQRQKIERLKLNHRKVFKIDNPFLDLQTPFADKRLWFDPSTYK